MNISPSFPPPLSSTPFVSAGTGPQAQRGGMRCSSQQRGPHPTRADPPADISLLASHGRSEQEPGNANIRRKFDELMFSTVALIFSFIVINESAS